ncbi:hypothetical protein FRC01_010920 [Tulasnella sp. 417]|nr:hypothetical protein FRC01_010920 [Tulasnella sp. 417]
MDTATLWAIADWRCSPDQVKTYLKRSKDSLIKVKYDSISMTCLRNRDSKNLWWEDSPILEHMARWGDVELALDFEAELEGLCGLAAPELRKLAIDYRSGPLSKPVHLFEGNTPKLRTMDLRGVHLHWEWDAAMIANLRSLALQGVQISKASTQSFLSVVRSAPMLEELILRNLQLDSDANLRPASPSNLNLHSLKELCITDVSYDIFRYFFGTIRAPNVKKVALDLPSFWNVEGWSKLLLGCLDNALLKLVGEARRLELYFDHRTFQMSGIPDVGPPSLFRLEWESLRLPLEAVEWVLKNILVYRKWPTLTVRFSGCMETYIQNILPSLFWLEDVTAVELELDVPFEYSPDHSFLSCRSVSVTDRPAAGKQWLWPNLTTVTINGQGWVGAGDYMLSIVNSRRQASSDPNDLNSIGVSRKVVPIQRVRIKDLSKLSESAAEQLQSLVPDIQLPSPEQLITASPTPNSGELNVFQRILDLLSG